LLRDALSRKMSRRSEHDIGVDDRVYRTNSMHSEVPHGRQYAMALPGHRKWDDLVLLSDYEDLSSQRTCHHFSTRYMS
jgi:hypothetical protein